MAATIILGIGSIGFSQSEHVWLVDGDKRARVMGFFRMAFQGAATFGSLLAGLLAGSVGVRAAVVGAGALVLFGAIFFATQLPRSPSGLTGLLPVGDHSRGGERNERRCRTGGRGSMKIGRTAIVTAKK